MKEEPALGAVKIDRRRRSISVATLGKPEAAAQLEESLTQQIHQLERSGQDQSCDLLGGKSDCSVCPVPLSSDDRKRVTIEHGADTTTISRVTCPTAPSFWRWRDIPWPKLVPREVALPDEAAHEDEWKLQLLAAGLCGLFGLTAFALGGRSLSVRLRLAYAAGAWFGAGPGNGCRRAVDVFFMLAVAAESEHALGRRRDAVISIFAFGALSITRWAAPSINPLSVKTTQRSRPCYDKARTFQPVEQLHRDELIIKPGELFPVDAEVLRIGLR